MPPELWWSPTQGLVYVEHRHNEKVLIRIMTPDHSRPPGGRTFLELPADANPMTLSLSADEEAW